jgi:hypothetical protein
VVSYHRTRRSRSAHAIGKRSTAAAETNTTRAYTTQGGATLALEVLEHLTQSRLRIFDLMDLKADGTWTTRALKTTPWLWRFRRRDVSEHSRELLAARFGMTFD